MSKGIFNLSTMWPQLSVVILLTTLCKKDSLFLWLSCQRIIIYVEANLGTFSILEVKVTKYIWSILKINFLPFQVSCTLDNCFFFHDGSGWLQADKSFNMTGCTWCSEDIKWVLSIRVFRELYIWWKPCQNLSQSKLILKSLSVSRCLSYLGECWDWLT